jgi:SAM-dependent methyltransferase
MEKSNESNDDNYVPEFESQLGKVDYWDNFYLEEINQFKNNSDLIGEIWFGEKVQNKVINYIREFFPDKNTKIVDLGCGNAAFLLKLTQAGYCNLYGMDYSKKSIELAQEILDEKLKDKKNLIKLYQEDINTSDSPTEHDFQLIHDKGTFDAFMSSKTNCVDNYLKYILSLRKPVEQENGISIFFIITSCNYSYSELESLFAEDKSKMKIIKTIPHQSFNFGGSSGQVVTTIVFSFNI